MYTTAYKTTMLKHDHTEEEEEEQQQQQLWLILLCFESCRCFDLLSLHELLSSLSVGLSADLSTITHVKTQNKKEEETTTAAKEEQTKEDRKGQSTILQTKQSSRRRKQKKNRHPIGWEIDRPLEKLIDFRIRVSLSKNTTPLIRILIYVSENTTRRSQWNGGRLCETFSV